MTQSGEKYFTIFSLNLVYCQQEGQELNGTHQLLVYGDVNMLGKNPEKAKYMAMSCHQNAGQNHD
jgi:hypothetical protein